MKQFILSILSILLTTTILAGEDLILLKQWTFKNKDQYKKSVFCYAINKECKISSEYDLKLNTPAGVGVFKIKVVKTDLKSQENLQFLMIYSKGFVKDKVYRVTVVFKTDRPCELGINIQKASSPWTHFSKKTITAKGGEWKKISYNFKAGFSFEGKSFAPGVFFGKVPAGTKLEFAMIKLEQIK